ncbi:MAG: apolipoprotein N-acyltransferase [Alphaproteobacteria bacterium]
MNNNPSRGPSPIRSLVPVAEFIASRKAAWRLLIALLTGICAAFAMAPYHLVPLLIASFTVLVWQIDGLGEKRRLLQAAFIGWFFGIGFFAAGVYWVGNAFLVDAATFGALMPAAVISLAVGLGLFPLVAVVLARLFWCKGASRVAVLAIAWSLIEWLRGHILTGFPWNLFDATWGDTLPVMQVVSLIGSYGLSLLTALAAASPAALIKFRDGRAELAPVRAAYWPAGSFALFVLIATFGAIRLSLPAAPDVPHIKLRLIQPSVPQRDKLSGSNAPEIFAKHLRLMMQPGAETITHFIWSEAAVPDTLADDPAALKAIGEILRPKQWLIAGSVRYVPPSGGKPERYYNSLFVIDTEGRIVASYDKRHLVPFGEYLPLKWFFSAIGMKQLVENESGFAHGNSLATIAVPGIPPFSPLICYEAIFPGEVVDPMHRPHWLLNITDDTWFGHGAGPRQHFESARLRAIEEGLPLVRAANNGISAVIDSKGRIRKYLPLDAVGTLDSALPVAESTTIFARIGDSAWFALVLALGGLSLTARRH